MIRRWSALCGIAHSRGNRITSAFELRETAHLRQGNVVVLSFSVSFE